jgi:ABC-type polysaccharide/polyol phosphate export permease
MMRTPRAPRLISATSGQYRELLYFLTWRDIKVKYKQTAMGAAWAIIQPLFMVIVFAVFFGIFMGVPTEGYLSSSFFTAG